VGDGSGIYLWIESWHPDGILFDKYGFRFIYDAGSKLDARLKLSSVIRGRSWHWLPARSVSMVAIQSQLPLVNWGIRIFHCGCLQSLIYVLVKTLRKPFGGSNLRWIGVSLASHP
jgi:hypothetical protein